MDNSVFDYFVVFFTYGVDADMVEHIFNHGSRNKRLALEAYLAFGEA